MIVVHGNWLPSKGRFLLWGETPVIEPAGSAADHPYQLASERIEESLLAPLAEPESKLDFQREQIELLLPTEGSAPVPSPELLLEREAGSTGERRIAPWRVSGVTLSPESALSWLVMLPTPEELDPHRFRLGAG
ncbi:MAG: hypothetical protein ACRD3V_12010, partial [Vicinamibacteria bacterium]